MSSESQAQKALSLLFQRSLPAHQAFKQAVLNQTIGVEKPDKAVEQYLSSWNDTIRQGILSIAYEAIGGKPETIMPLQVALTFIDATMDIHDDIIDDSATKRNIKTMYGKLGTGSTLLVGDAFLVKGFYHLHQAIQNLPKERQAQLMSKVNNFLAEVVKAHISESQLRPKKWLVKPHTYFEILSQKAAEIEGRLIVTGIYGGASEKELQALGTYGRNLGILLAVRAEYTDLFEPYELLNRVKYECLPLQLLYALQKRGCRDKIQLLLSRPTLSNKDAYSLLKTINETGALETLNDQLRCIQKDALEAISILQSCEAKNNLELIIASMLEDMC